MLDLISIYYYTLFEPEILSLKLQKVDKKFFYFHRFFLSLLISASILLLSKTLKFSHVFFMLLLALLIFLYIVFSSRIVNFTLLQKISNKEKFENLDNFYQFLKNSNYIIELSWLPFMFLIHFCIISNYFKNFIICFIGIIILWMWQFYILIRGIQYHFEWEVKITIKEIIKSFGIQFFLSVYLLIFLALIFVIFIT